MREEMNNHRRDVMQSFEEGQGRETEPTKLSTKLALLAGALLVLVVVTVLGLQGRYIDVEQAVQVSDTEPTAVAIRDSKTGR
jgi:hypothetical protein